MASPSSVSTHLEDDSEWQYRPRLTKRHKRGSTSGASKPSPREIGYMREPHNDGSASFLGSSSGIHFVRHVYSAFARRSADLQQSRARDRSSVPGEDDRLLRDPGNQDTNELWNKDEVNLSSTATFSFEDLVQWTRRYFENWHPIFPCLHAPTVLKTMETLGHHGLGSINRLDLMVIRCLVSVSLADSRQVQPPVSQIGPIPAPLVFQTVQHIMQEIQSLLAEPTTLQLLQATFTAQLTMTSLLRLNAASRVGGIVTRTAFHLGLHRCPGRFACFSSEEADIRRRLFWSIYSLERYLSQALGVPLSIRDDDIDVCYPGAERHADPSSQPSLSRLQLMCHLAKFARVRGLILELRNKSILHSHAGTAEASQVNGELTQWWNEVYDDVYPIEDESEAGPDQNPILTPYHRLLVMILRHEAIISMNRPLLAAEKPNPDYKNALQTCIGSSRSLLAALKKYMSSSSDAPLTWPSFTWITWMACLILMYASWEGELPIPTALKYAKMGTAVLENLALRGSSWPETCIEAIRSMESALLSMSASQESSSASSVNERGLTRNQNGPPRTVTPRRPVSVNPAFTPSDNQGTNETYAVPSSTTTQRFGTTMNPSMHNPGEPSSAFIRHDHQGHAIELPSSDAYSANGQTSAGLIFGNMANRNANLYPGNIVQDSQPFSDAPAFMNDLWSVADGPWIIDGNLL
ncbi:transcriptional regulator family: Fungal Specific TF [Penicillium longicatenatum]|uniref:transcriptional regulator family: Fungal Specific TF n=1 Tax=Penicillium longicatenatum TaxID=1561947 RepID=UPI002548291A|nr:transcriptional regulator family: Fungal Specific TF [Penicillium longicatenatum]KAJ5644042.1 transcriptional regulator family: Fungal Specific TF [Penicillium longicatenatum]